MKKFSCCRVTASVATAAFSLVSVSAVSADVTLMSRTSEASSYRVTSSGVEWIEGDVFDGVGPWETTLPHGFYHADTVTTTLMGGTFDGGAGGRASPYDVTYRASALRVEFAVGANTPVSLSFDGLCNPGREVGSSQSVQLEIFSFDNEEAVFNIWQNGTRRTDFGVTAWASQTWNGVLPPGMYELRVNASGLDTVTQAGSIIAESRVNFELELAGSPSCPADFNGDGFLDFFDYDHFVFCYETDDCGERSADFNEDGFIDFFDYDGFVAAFEAGCGN